MPLPQCLFLLASALSPALALQDPPIPIWGAAVAYRVNINMTDVSDAPDHPDWTFGYFYMTTSNGTFSRYEMSSDQHDEVCKGIFGAPALGTAACTVIHSTNANWMYISFRPVVDFCCKCTQNIGAVRSDWLQDGDANYTGRVEADVDGKPFPAGRAQADSWLKYGASDNHYYASADAQQLPVRYMEHKNEKLKQWDFDLSSYVKESWATPPAEYFAPPENCETRCKSLMCAFAEEEDVPAPA